MKLTAGRCLVCGTRWKKGQHTKKYCSETCRVEAFWRRKFTEQDEQRKGERRQGERRTSAKVA